MSLPSPIRTLTVGSGITPDLLTFHIAVKALAGFQLKLIYRRWGISPRPENKRTNYNANHLDGQSTKVQMLLHFLRCGFQV
jgi:hypothetical protein